MKPNVRLAGRVRTLAHIQGEARTDVRLPEVLGQVERTMSYQFVRMQHDGRVASITPHKLFDTMEQAKAAAPDLLASRKGGGRIVLMQAMEVAITSSDVRYEAFK